MPADPARRPRLGWQLIPLGILGLILISWVVLEGLGLLDLTAALRSLSGVNRALAVAAIVGLLVADIVIPVPSAAVFILAGTIFGVVGGIAVAVAGSMAASALAYGLGRLGRGRLDGPWMSRLIDRSELAAMDAWWRRWGRWTFVLARTLPMIPETVGISAGISRLPFGPFLGYTFAGTLPVCALYVLAGNWAHTAEEILMTIFGGFLIAAVGIALLRRWIMRPASDPAD